MRYASGGLRKFIERVAIRPITDGGRQERETDGRTDGMKKHADSGYPETSGIVDRTLEGDAGDEDAVGSIDAVAFADVKA